MKELISASWLKKKKEISTPKKEKKSKLSEEWLKSLLESFNRVKKELPIL
jgi:hypothetical protein